MSSRHISLIALLLPILGGMASSGVGVAAAQAGIRPAIPAGTGGEQVLLQGVGVDERFDAVVPSDATFRDHQGREVTLGSILDDRPVLLHFVWHDCATLCGLAMDGVVDALVKQPWTAGIEFQVVTLSMSEHDTPAHAADARGRVLGRYSRTDAERGWHFLTGDAESIARVATAVGYRFRWDDATQQYLHPAVVMLLTPQHTVGRYLYGLELGQADLRLGLADVAEGRQLSMGEQLLMFCYRFDAHESRYVLASMRLMQLGGAITALALGGFLYRFWRRETQSPPGPGTPTDPNSSPPPSAPRAREV